MILSSLKYFQFDSTTRIYFDLPGDSQQNVWDFTLQDVYDYLGMGLDDYDYDIIDSINEYIVDHPPVGIDANDFYPQFNYNKYEYVTLRSFHFTTNIDTDELKAPYLDEVIIDGEGLQLLLGCNLKVTSQYHVISPVSGLFPFWGNNRLPVQTVTEVSRVGIYGTNTKVVLGGIINRDPIKKIRKRITFMSMKKITNSKYLAVNGFKYVYRIQEKHEKEFDLFIANSQNERLYFDSTCSQNLGEGKFRMHSEESFSDSTAWKNFDVLDREIILYRAEEFDI